MQSYKDLLKRVVEEGERHDNRTGIWTLSLFGAFLEHDMRTGFPLLTTKFVHFKSIVHELLWFLRGDTNAKYLKDRGVTIWNDWATNEQCAKFGRQENDLGHVYGGLWRNFTNNLNAKTELSHSPHLPSSGNELNWCYNDQIYGLCRSLETEPQSRRLLVSGWHPVYQREVELPPCHTLHQFKCHGNDGLSLHFYMRSCDIFLGLPFNIASYALLLRMVAACTGREARRLSVSFGDLHAYSNHMSQIEEQLSREPRALPEVSIAVRDLPTVFDRLMAITDADITLCNYDPHSKLKAPVAV